MNYLIVQPCPPLPNSLLMCSFLGNRAETRRPMTNRNMTTIQLLSSSRSKPKKDMGLLGVILFSLIGILYSLSIYEICNEQKASVAEQIQNWG